MHCEEGQSRVRSRRRGHSSGLSGTEITEQEYCKWWDKAGGGEGTGSRQRAARAKVLTWIKPAVLGEQQGGQCGRRRDFPREEVARGGGREAAGIRSSRPLWMVDLL